MEYFIDTIGAEYKKRVNGALVSFIMCKCNICNNEYEARTGNIKRKNRTVCRDCKGKSLPSYIDSKNKRLYATWCLIKRRVDNTNVKKHGNDTYYNGINMCEEWKDFNTFNEWCYNNGFEEGLTIDRKNPYGDYEPNNCRFVSSAIQSVNKRIRKENKTGYIGVGLSGRESFPYYCRVSFDKKTYLQKRFKTIREAVMARNETIIKNNLPIEIQEYEE